MGPNAPSECDKQSAAAKTSSLKPADRTIDTSLLEDKTENYVSADIFKIVVEASRKAEMADTGISEGFLLAAISENPPSVPPTELERYERIRAEWEGYRNDSRTRPSIGFVVLRAPVYQTN